MNGREQHQDPAVKMGVQVGGVLAREVAAPHYDALDKLLRKHCVGPYSPEIDDFSLVLRVDGDVWYWEQEGCDRMRRRRKDRYITIDMYLPRPRWEGVSGIEIRRYLLGCTEDALKRMIARLQRDKAVVDGDALLRDFARVKERYLPQIINNFSTADPTKAPVTAEEV